MYPFIMSTSLTILYEDAIRNAQRPEEAAQQSDAIARPLASLLGRSFIVLGQRLERLAR